MDSKQFEDLAKARVTKCLTLMKVVKGPEYARKGDRLLHFKDAGQLQRITPEDALLGMWSKHLISIIDIIKDISAGRTWSMEQLREKLTDSINYHLLLEGLVEERIK